MLVELWCVFESWRVGIDRKSESNDEHRSDSSPNESRSDEFFKWFEYLHGRVRAVSRKRYVSKRVALEGGLYQWKCMGQAFSSKIITFYNRSYQENQ